MRLSQSVELKAPASEVWTFVSDFYNFQTWQPHIESTARGPASGERIVKMKRGNTILDRIAVLDNEKRTLAYEMVPNQELPPGAPKLEGFLATFIVNEAGSGSEVEYSIAVEVPSAIQEMAEKGIGSDIAGALQGLKDKFGAV
ncbi:SRPBCC family protein [Rhizobium sp. CG5]|uniref:SRPBCC family protein n=1 Tax=Rhizobium sp. CG5 TaxID=2726076 RepID=UPI0020347A0A|nr:SRPBCC family protein [Rhizobium sp. CG5]MCM2472403.1 SRPBCC family protein [Rhizobium sp. CG5]